MLDAVETEYADTLEVEGDEKSSARVLSAIAKAERALNAWQGICDNIDDIYAREGRDNPASWVNPGSWIDPEYDLFWSSMEIMKPAIYARPPQPVVSPQFKDRRKLQNLTAEVLERSVTSAFDRTGLDEAMLCTRDDLIFYNRGQLWVTYETDEKGGGQRVCVEHLDRKDFLHPPARKWSEVPWTARRAWMTKEEMGKRFREHSGDAYEDATACQPNQRDDDGGTDHSRKIGVWEVWHKADNRVYWVSPGVRVMLDEGVPHLKLRGFFPCPRPAYGTLRPRTLVPVPDYLRYEAHFRKINSLTKRIYDLLDMIRMKGLIPAGGDVGDAVEQALRDDSNTALLIPVPAATLIAGSSAGFVQWMPLADIATAIQGLIEARRELFADYDRLSGISDIMRGETEANETLGAQRLKSQYGSVRVREKIDELQRIARDVTQISAEIMAENFSKETLLEMSQMEVPTKAEISRRIEDVEKEAEGELRQVMQQGQQMAAQAQQQGQEVDPQQAQAQLQQAQQQIIAKYAPMLRAAGDAVPVEDVMGLLRDGKARGFAFEIATDSTIMTDEMQEKASRNEFLTVFTGATQGLTALASLGEPGAKLAGEILKFVLQPYRVGRELNSVIDEFIDAAPQMAEQAKGEGEDDGLAAAQMELAKAEMAKVESQTAANQANSQLKMQELQLKAAEAQEKARQTEQQFTLSVQEAQGKISETEARIEKIRAEIELAQQKLGLEVHREEREDVKTAADIQMRQTDQILSAQDRERQAVESDRDAAFRAQESQRAERQQTFTERSSDRQMTLAERQAQAEGKRK